MRSPTGSNLPRLPSTWTMSRSLRSPRVLDSKVDNRRRKCKLLYLVHWDRVQRHRRRDPHGSLRWKLGNAPELISDFHLAYPTKPGPLNRGLNPGVSLGFPLPRMASGRQPSFISIAGSMRKNIHEKIYYITLLRQSILPFPDQTPSTSPPDPSTSGPPSPLHSSSSGPEPSPDLAAQSQQGRGQDLFHVPVAGPWPWTQALPPDAPSIPGHPPAGWMEALWARRAAHHLSAFLADLVSPPGSRPQWSSATTRHLVVI